jgi:hypothetical protein
MLNFTEFYLSEFTVYPFSTMCQGENFLGANKSHDASQGYKEANAKFALKETARFLTLGKNGTYS